MAIEDQMANSVRVALPSDVSSVIAVIDNGFSEDPTVRWLHPTYEEFRSLHHKFVGSCIAQAIAFGGVHYLTGFEGAAIWYRPGIKFGGTVLEEIASQAALPERFEVFFDLLGRCSKFRPAEPYWELELIAVEPGIQGRGFGTMLLEYGLTICDQEHAPVYLESSNEDNLKFYNQCGFELLSEVHLSGAPKRFPMIRKAR
ncbi:MAG: GNAT family N-acetyltransferase [Pseudomonadota bacterium]